MTLFYENIELIDFQNFLCGKGETEMKIAVSGTGVCLAEKGHSVSCVDIDGQKVELMMSGISTIFEPGLEELMGKNKDRINFTTNYKEAYRDANVIFIGVGTPEKHDGYANLNFVYLAATEIAQSIEKDCVVIVKSTVPVGTNDKIELIKANLSHKVNVHIASNPEFLAQGTAVRDTLYHLELS